MLKFDVICMSHDYILLLKITGAFLFHYIPLEIKEIFPYAWNVCFLHSREAFNPKEALKTSEWPPKATRNK